MAAWRRGGVAAWRRGGVAAWRRGGVVVWVIHLLISGRDRRTAPKFGTHVRIDTLTLKKINPPHPGGGLGGYIILLKIFRDGSRPNLARMCG